MNAALALRLACAGQVPALSPEAISALEACDAVEVSQLAAVHKVAPWLVAAISKEPRLDLAEFPGLAAAAGGQTFHSLRLFSELSSVVTRLNEADVPVVVLKGPVLAQTTYPDAALRPYNDVDVLIHEKHLVEVSRLLLSRGYLEKNGAHDHEADRLHDCHGVFQRIFMNEQTGLIVEVHCDHLQIGLEPVGMDQIWAASSPFAAGRGVGGALETHDMFVQLCVHLQRHNYERLIWFKDLDLLVRNGAINWHTIRTRSVAQGALGAVSYTLWLLPRLLGTPLPKEAARLAAAQGRLSRLLYRRVWAPTRIAALTPQRQWRFRRLVQFAPETGLLRGGTFAFTTGGRRKDKARILWAGLRRQFR